MEKTTENDIAVFQQISIDNQNDVTEEIFPTIAHSNGVIYKIRKF
jgi:hypothetical protein